MPMTLRLYEKISSLSLNSRQFFAIFGAYFVILGFLSLILAVAGIFYAIIIEIYLILGAFSLIIIFLKNKKTIRFDKEFLLILAISILAIGVFSFYSNPTIFSGRDQGSLSEAAIRLSQNHKLEFSNPASKALFGIYGHGKALNFPGFSYNASGDLTTQFPIGYISWMAGFFSIFGLPGLIIANGVSFFIFLLSFYFIGQNFLEKKPAWIAFLLILTSFVFSWFFKFTLSENLALMLLWFGAMEFYIFIKNQKKFDLTVSFLSLGLLLFSRLEGVAFILIAFLILFINGKKIKKTFFETIGRKNLILIFSIALLYLINIFINNAFYLSFAKDIFHSSFQSGSADTPENLWAESFFSLKVLSAYAISNLLILGILGVIYLLKKRRIEKLVLFLLMLPTFIYLVDPHISNDHPWMLRRFVFSIIPISILYGTLFLDKFFKRKAFLYVFGVILIATNLMVAVPYITFKPYKNLLPQIGKLSANFKDSDLVLVDREATGDAFAMMSGPMNFIFNKQTVYFFNPEDLSKINQANFSNIYLVVPDKNLEFYRLSGLLAKMIPQKDYMIDMPDLNVIMDEHIDFKTSVNLPEKENLITYGKIYLLKK